MQKSIKLQEKGTNFKQSRLRVDKRRKLFTMRVVKHWHRFPREVVDAPSLETFKVSLDGALSNLSWRCPCSLQEGWTRWPLKVPSNPNCSVILRYYQFHPHPMPVSPKTGGLRYKETYRTQFSCYTSSALSSRLPMRSLILWQIYARMHYSLQLNNMP